LPQLRDLKTWEVIDHGVGEWYERLAPENFWNTIHGMSIGLRLKSLVPILTSLNVKWAEKDIAVNELWFGGKFGPIKIFNCAESVSDLKLYLTQPENKEVFKQELKASDERSLETTPRDHFPVFVVREDEKYRVIDGNRRLLRAILKNQDNIFAAVGEPRGTPMLYEHWVPTSLLVDLVFWHNKQMMSGIDITAETAKVIFEMIRNSSMGRREFENRAVHRDDETHKKLLDAVLKLY
jgi:hypothetical protein